MVRLGDWSTQKKLNLLISLKPLWVKLRSQLTTQILKQLDQGQVNHHHDLQDKSGLGNKEIIEYLTFALGIIDDSII